MAQTRPKPRTRPARAAGTQAKAKGRTQRKRAEGVGEATRKRAPVRTKRAQPTAAQLRRLTAQRGQRMVERWRTAIRAEIANAVTHGIGAGMSITGLVVLVVIAAREGTVWHVIGCAIFGTTLVLLYMASTLYHSLPYPRAKRVFRILDHSAIYLLIAGSYTPFMLVNVHGAWGWSIFGVIWGLAVCGVVFKVFFVGRFDVISTIVYILMGWVVVVAWSPVKAAIPTGGLVLLVLGGLSYTGGTIFYAWHRLPFHHAIWHLFVLGGSVLHYLAVLNYVLPARLT